MAQSLAAGILDIIMANSNKQKRLQQIAIEVKKARQGIDSLCRLEEELKELIAEECPSPVDSNREYHYVKLFDDIFSSNGYQKDKWGIREIKIDVTRFIQLMLALESDDKDNRQQAIYMVEHMGGRHFENWVSGCDICDNDDGW